MQVINLEEGLPRMWRWWHRPGHTLQMAHALQMYLDVTMSNPRVCASMQQTPPPPPPPR